MPPPTLDEGQADALAMLFLLQTKMREEGMKAGKIAVEVKHDGVRAALQKESEALAQAVEAGNGKGFWDDVGGTLLTVAEVAAVVGSIALAVVSCGAATGVAVLAIAGAVMSTAGFVQGEFHVLEKLGVDASVGDAIGLGLSIGGAACSVGAGVAAAAATTAQAAQASKLGNVASTTATVSGTAAGGVTIAAGGARIASAEAQADAADAGAEALKEQLRAQWLQKQIESIIEELKGSDASDGRILDGMRVAMMTRGDTLLSSVRA